MFLVPHHDRIRMPRRDARVVPSRSNSLSTTSMCRSRCLRSTRYTASFRQKSMARPNSNETTRGSKILSVRKTAHLPSVCGEAKPCDNAHAFFRVRSRPIVSAKMFNGNGLSVKRPTDEKTWTKCCNRRRNDLQNGPSHRRRVNLAEQTSLCATTSDACAASDDTAQRAAAMDVAHRSHVRSPASSPFLKPALTDVRKTDQIVAR